jgi:hypothetical protein
MNYFVNHLSTYVTIRPYLYRWFGSCIGLLAFVVFPAIASANLTISPSTGTDGLFQITRTAGEGWYFYNSSGGAPSSYSPAYADPCGGFSSNVWSCDLTGASGNAGSAGSQWNGVYGTYTITSADANCASITLTACLALSPAYVLTYVYSSAGGGGGGGVGTTTFRTGTIDDFENYNNNPKWTSYSFQYGGSDSFNLVTSNCYQGTQCLQGIDQVGSGNTPHQNLSIAATPNGRVSIYGYTDITGASSAPGVFAIGTTSSQGITYLDHYSVNTIGYHLYTMYWRSVPTDVYIQTCNLLDTVDITQCDVGNLWTDSTFAVSQLPQFFDIYLLAQSTSHAVTFDLLTGDGAGGLYSVSSYISTTTPKFSDVVPLNSNFVMSAGGYVLPSDFISGYTNVHVQVYKSVASLGQVSSFFSTGGVDADPFFGTLPTVPDLDFYLPISSSGSFSVSNGVYLGDIGYRVVKWQLEVPVYSFLGFIVSTKVLYSTTTLMLVSTSSNLDNIAIDQAAAVAALNGTSTIATTTSPYCDPVGGDFSVALCSAYLFVPSVYQEEQVGNGFSSILSRGPWGYVTRAQNLITGNAVSSDPQTISPNLPVLVVDFKGLHFPMTQNATTLNLTPWNELMGSSSILGTAEAPDTGLTFKQIVEPGWDFLVVFMFGFAMFMQILGVNITGGVENNIRNSRRQSR